MLESKQKRNMKLLDLDLNGYEEYIKRLMYFLLAQDRITKKTLENSFFILSEIKEKQIQAENEKIKYKTKCPKILKYRDEIVMLYKEGLGDIRISNAMWENHRVKISKDKIRHFIKNNGIVRNG